MAQNAAVDRNAGAGGFDWAFHQYDTVGADDDMAINNFLDGLPLPRGQPRPLAGDRGRLRVEVRRRHPRRRRRTAASSAAPGSSAATPWTRPASTASAACRRSRRPPLPTRDGGGRRAGHGAARSRARVWGEGDILLGGDGSDTITGRGGDDIIDGDRALRSASASAPTRRTRPRDRQRRPDGEPYCATRRPAHRADAAGRSGLRGGRPGRPTIGRSHRRRPCPPWTAACRRPRRRRLRRRRLSRPRASYTITEHGRSITVNQTVAPVAPQKISDGIDTLRNVEQLKFADQTVLVARAATLSRRASRRLGALSARRRRWRRRCPSR